MPYEPKDARDHINTLLNWLNTQQEYDEANLRVDLGHIYSHLNRAWHRRNAGDDLNETEWVQASQFPTDLEVT